MKFFPTPSDMISHEKRAQMMYGRYFLPLQGTLGWCEMEVAMWEVLQRMAAADNDWLESVDLKGVDDVTAFDPDIGVRRFTEYFEEIKGRYYIRSEALVKLHRGISKRDDDGNN